MSGARVVGASWVRALSALCVAVVGLAACGDSLVGGECARGYRARGGACVSSDGGLEAGADSGDDGGVDAAVDAGPDATVDAGPPTGCPVGTLDCDGACVRPDIDPAHCGDCDTACALNQVCAGGDCVASCQPPRTTCADGCVNTEDDPSNCGVCDNDCASGVCSASACQLTAPGHLVVIGHDYASSNAPMRRLLGNAVFLAQGSPVEVLAYDGTVALAQRNGVDAAIDSVAGFLGRSWAPVSVPDEFITYQLASVDVFLIYPQATGTNAELLALGATWAAALQEFLSRGGIVVLADGPAASHDGTWQLLEGAGVFSANGRTTANGDTLTADLPVDAVMVGVPVSYTGLGNTVWFDTAEQTPIVSHPDGPVVIHRVAVP
jgi:hypothetical protein